MDNRQVPITVGQSFNIAAQIVTSDPEFVPGPGTIGEIAVLASSLADVILDAQSEAEQKFATNTVQAAFPGTQQVASVTPLPTAAAYPVHQPQQAAPQAEPFSAQPQQYQAAPAAIPGTSDGDPATAALWVEYFNNPAAWWDNRGNKRNPRAPDFKHRDNPDKALWIVGKKNPSWVSARLGA